MLEILFATKNPSKVTRFAKPLEQKNIKIITLNDLDLELDVEENGNTCIDNAKIKAWAYYKATGIPTFAVDDSLFLENVPSSKQPGTCVRRVNGKRLTDQEMINYYCNLVKEYGTNSHLTARWIYGLAIIKDNQEYTYSWSKKDFDLVDTPSSNLKPGYPLDSISVYKELNKYFTDLTDEDKVSLEVDESDVVQFIIDSLR